MDVVTLLMCRNCSVLVDGKFFAELHRDVTFKRVAAQKNKVAIEPRLSVYGRKRTE